MYRGKKAELIERLSNLEFRISITTDTWTSTNRRAFMAVTAHFLDKNWSCCDVLLDFIHLDDLKHSGEVMAMKLYECLLDYGIEKNIMILVSDNASSMYKLAEHLRNLLSNFHPDEHHSGGINHVFNLAVQDGLKSIGLKDASDAMYPHFEDASVINKLRQFAKYVRSSQRRQKFLNRAPLGNEHQKLMVILDVCTRWNSVHDMLLRALEVKQSIEVIIAIENVPQLIISPE